MDKHLLIFNIISFMIVLALVGASFHIKEEEQKRIIDINTTKGIKCTKP